jgi:hypothetical protein
MQMNCNNGKKGIELAVKGKFCLYTVLQFRQIKRVIMVEPSITGQ